MKKYLKVLLVLVLLPAFLYSGLQVYQIFSAYARADAQYAKLAQYVTPPPLVVSPEQREEAAPMPSIVQPPAPSVVQPSVVQPSAPTEEAPAAAPEPVEEILWPQVDFEALAAINPDIVGWIYCPDTNINYPIVQGESNQSYLYRSHTGERNANGSIFLDFRNLRDFSDFNNIIYGHNMGVGEMFGTLKQFADQKFYEEHPVMWLLTPDKAFRLDLIAGMVTPSDSETYELFSYQEDLHERMEYALSHSSFDAGEVDISQITQVLTLSTCSYEYATARYVVIGSMVQIGYPEPPAAE